MLRWLRDRRLRRLVAAQVKEGPVTAIVDDAMETAMRLLALDSLIAAAGPVLGANQPNAATLQGQRASIVREFSERRLEWKAHEHSALEAAFRRLGEIPRVARPRSSRSNRARPHANGREEGR